MRCRLASSWQPGDERDLAARVAALELRAGVHNAVPLVDDDGRLHYRGTLLPLAPVPAQLAEVLIGRFGDVVSDRDLDAARAGLDIDEPSLQTQMARLRSGLREVGLTLSRVPRRGYRVQRS